MIAVCLWTQDIMKCMFHYDAYIKLNLKYKIWAAYKAYTVYAVFHVHIYSSQYTKSCLFSSHI